MESTNIANYKIVSLIGKGGMSEVYEGQDINTHEKVALKIIDKSLGDDNEYNNIFLRESLAASRLKHPNIVKILSYGKYKDSFYIAFEYVEGITLDKLIKSKSLSIEEIEKISVQVLAGLSYAHSQNVIHRDIKPSNIMITNGDVKILDFGIAKSTSRTTITSTGMFMGSPHYISPEQIRGIKVDARADLYSFGIVLYEMIQGKVPFSADTPLGYMNAHLKRQAPKITRGIPSYLSRIVYKCLAKKPNDRFKSADEIIGIIKTNAAGSKVVTDESLQDDKTVIKRRVEKIRPVRERTQRLIRPKPERKVDDPVSPKKPLNKMALTLGIAIPILVAVIILMVVKLGNRPATIAETSTATETTITAEAASVNTAISEPAPTVVAPETTMGAGTETVETTVAETTATESTTSETTAVETTAVETTAESTAIKAEYNIGDIGPAGGYIFYVNPNYAQDGWHYLEAAPRDQISKIPWSNGSDVLTNANMAAIGTGKINTQRILDAQGEGKYAAKICSDLTINGYSDWFLPSLDELNQMRLNLYLKGHGRFIPGGYWSSTESNESLAWFQGFMDGPQYAVPKGEYPGCVRAIRSF